MSAVETLARSTALEWRARQSLGASHTVIYQLVAEILAAHGVAGARLVDVGCGGGGLLAAVRPLVASYCGLDAVRYDGLPADAEFHCVNLDDRDWPLPAATADVVAAVETIEHLENPWAFMRQLAALARPGGWVCVTTPNQLSALSLLTLVVKRRFSAFQDSHYPAHRTALLECDLRRAAFEAGLEPRAIRYTGLGRVPGTPWHYPRAITRLWPRGLSDNVLLLAHKP